MTQRVAAIDCGTNSIRLLIADIDTAANTLADRLRTMEIVRLGEGVDRTGRLADAALTRTFAACDGYAELIQAHGAERVRFVATSATRDATNRDEFAAGIRQRLGVEPEVISGETEARLSFLGSTRSLGAALGTEPILVVDIGGGSTEFVLGSVATGVQAACSVDIGCVRITERCLHSDPPTPAEVALAQADIDDAIAAAGRQVPLRQAQGLVGLAGSVTTLAAMAAKLDAYDPLATHGSRLTAAQVAGLTQRLLTSSRAERAAVPVMHPGRVDVIAAGAMILQQILAATAIEQLLVSEHDILDGIAWSLVEV